MILYTMIENTMFEAGMGYAKVAMNSGTHATIINAIYDISGWRFIYEANNGLSAAEKKDFETWFQKMAAPKNKTGFDWVWSVSEQELIRNLSDNSVFEMIDVGGMYCGSLRTGNICVDLVKRNISESSTLEIVLFGDFYVSGPDTGYGYCNGIPYDCAEDTVFCIPQNKYIGESLKEFRLLIEKTAEAALVRDDMKYMPAYSLIRKANEKYNGGFKI